jgi:D-tyrosyl-tRNA(Tyr) deacylase
MRAVVTRVKSASVAIDGKTVGEIGVGFLVLLGVHEDGIHGHEFFWNCVDGYRHFGR